MGKENHHHNDKESKRTPEEYRARLLNKLNCLIAVLEVAISKIQRSLESPAGNADRLEKIRSNLENTLVICRRARVTLEKNGKGSSAAKLKTEEISELLKNQPNPGELFSDESSKPKGRRHMSYRDYVELSSVQEYQKFKKLPPIKKEEIQTADVDSLIKKFLAG